MGKKSAAAVMVWVWMGWLYWLDWDITVLKKKTREREDAPIASVDWFKSKPTCNYLPACCNWYLKGTTSFWSVLTLWSTTPLTPFSALRNPIVLLLSLLEYRKCVLSLPHIIFLFFSPWKLVRLFIKYKSPIKQQKRWSQAGFAKSEDRAPVYYGSPKVISIEQRANGQWWIFPAPIQLLFMVSLSPPPSSHTPGYLLHGCLSVCEVPALTAFKECFRVDIQKNFL